MVAHTLLEEEVGRLPELRSFRPAWENIGRLHLKKKTLSLKNYFEICWAW